MATRARKNGRLEHSEAPDSLKGWQQISAYLAQPTAVAQRWAREGMPVQRQGRFVIAKPEELAKWLGRESGEPVRVVTDQADLGSELKRALSEARKQRKKAA